MRIARSLQRFQRRLLRQVFGFDRWHVGHAGEPYGAAIVRHLNEWPEAERQSVVEIGCGLGDILRRLRFAARLGLDRDPRVLEAARFLSRFNLGPPPRFEVAEFPATRLMGTYNAIIMVNWIHDIAPEQLSSAVRDCFSQHLAHGGSLVLDTVNDAAYTYNHDIQRLAPPGAATDHLGRYSRNRDVWLIRRSL